MWEDSKQLNKYNHNYKGDPHPQYNHYKCYTSAGNPVNAERYVKIFEGNFHQNPPSLDGEIREYSRILYSAYIYNGLSDDTQQTVSEFTMLCMYKYDGYFYCEASNNTLLTNTNRDITMYYKTDVETGITNVKVYAKVTGNNEHIIIQPKIYNTFYNNKTPYHLKAAHYGVNTREKLDDLYSNFSTESFIDSTALGIATTDYTTVTITPNKLDSLLVLNEYHNTILQADNPGIKLKKKNGDIVGSIYYSNSSNCMAMENPSYWFIGGSLIPSDTTKSVGATWSKYLNGYFSGTVSCGTVNVATKTPASANATGTTGDICWDTNYVYVCVATNTWKRTAISTW